MARTITEDQLRQVIARIIDEEWTKKEKKNGNEKKKKDCKPEDKDCKDGKKIKEDPKAHEKKIGGKKKDFSKMSDDDLMEALVKKQLKEDGATTSDMAVGSAPTDTEDVEEDTTPITDTQEEEINLEESRSFMESVLEEAFKADESLDFPNFKKTIWIVENVFNVKIPLKYHKTLEEVYKKKVNKIVTENSNKDGYERLI
jgi:hypothetical protein